MDEREEIVLPGSDEATSDEGSVLFIGTATRGDTFRFVGRRDRVTEREVVAPLDLGGVVRASRPSFA